MAARLAETAERLGVPEHDRARIASAFVAAIGIRDGIALDDHHPDYLHPARTALILMDDVAVRDPATLIAGILAETWAPRLCVPPAVVHRFDPAVRGILDGLPATGPAERLREDLVTTTRESRLVALAERLDHARHLHLRATDTWADYHAATCAAYAPVATRAHPLLDRRFAWWCDTFRRRFLATAP